MYHVIAIAAADVVVAILAVEDIVPQFTAKVVDALPPKQHVAAVAT
jgi:hypothetical protein